MKLATFLCFWVALAAAATGPDETQIRDREKAWATAVAAGDTAALDSIFTDRLIYAHSTGKVETKREYLDRLKTGAQKYAHVTHEKIQVVPYGDTVVTHSFVRMDGTSNGKPFNDHVMMLHVWVKQGGSWRIAAHQTTKLIDPVK